MSAIEILGLDHVVVRVCDLDAALRFYGEALGCAVERRLDELGLIQLRAGSALIDLVPIESPLGRAGGGAPLPNGRNVDHFALEIAEFDAAAIRAQLVAHGVPEESIGDEGARYGARGSGPSLYVRDPDGNTVELKGPPDA
jgi:catechol 2,3-dioxygenase-like lactoylglutathione lyase family enzyme